MFTVCSIIFILMKKHSVVASGYRNISYKSGSHIFSVTIRAQGSGYAFIIRIKLICIGMKEKHINEKGKKNILVSNKKEV